MSSGHSPVDIKVPAVDLGASHFDEADSAMLSPGSAALHQALAMDGGASPSALHGHHQHHPMLDASQFGDFSFPFSTIADEAPSLESMADDHADASDSIFVAGTAQQPQDLQQQQQRQQQQQQQQQQQHQQQLHPRGQSIGSSSGVPERHDSVASLPRSVTFGGGLVGGVGGGGSVGQGQQDAGMDGSEDGTSPDSSNLMEGAGGSANGGGAGSEGGVNGGGDLGGDLGGDVGNSLDDPLTDEFGLGGDGRRDGTDLGAGGKLKSSKALAPPAWSELKTKAGKERKRLPLACIACRRKKIRCSGEKPACKHCLRSRIPCVYKVTLRKAAPRTDYMAMLDKRLKRMEERIIKIVPKAEHDSPSSGGGGGATFSGVTRAVVKPAMPGSTPTSKQSQQNGDASKKRAADEAFGADLDHWARAPTKTALNGAGSATKPSTLQQQEAEENKLLYEGRKALPPKEIQEHLAEVFFENIYGQAYHLLHKPSYMRKLKAGTLPPVLILSVCAVAARFSTHPKLNTRPNFLRGEQWASQAREIVTRRYEWPNITILTCLLILGLHEFGTCHGGRSWALGGMAIRMAFALQLHKDLEYDPLVRNGTTQLSFIDREIRRRTFWACFLMDRFNSSGTDRPMFIREESIKIQLPIKERHFQLDIPGPTENLHGDVPHPVSPDNGELADAHDNMGVAAYMIRSIALWGRIISYLNQGGKEQDPHPMWSPESEYARLIAQTEELETNLPESLRYSAENLRLHDTEAMANQFLFLHISIQQNILFMNRFAVAAPGALAHLDGVPVAFTTKAGGRAFQAANRISELLKDAESYFVAAPFVGYCAFLSSTVHIFGAFSGNRNVEQTSKRNLATNVRFLAKMKRYWGMFHWMSENLREQYRVCADAARQAAAAGTTGAAAGGAGTGSAASGTGSPGAGKDGSDATGTATSTASGVPPTTAAAAVSASSPIFQYGDWFDRYPHGVSQSDFVDPATRKNKEKGDDAVLEQRPELHTVEEFFTTLSPPQSAEGRDVPMTGTASNPGGGSGATGGGATGGNTAGSAASGGNRPSLLQQRKSIVGSAKKPPGAATTGTTGGAVGRADPGQLQPIVTDMANATAATLQQQQQQQQDQQQHSQQQQPHGGAMHPRAPHRTFSASRGLQTSGPGAPFNPLTIPHSANSTGYGVALSPISPVTHGHHGPPSATFYSPDLLAMSLAAGGHPLAGGPHGGPGGPGAAVMLPTQLDRQLVFGAYGADPGALGTPADVAAAAAAAAAASQGLSLDGTAVPWDNMPPTPGGSRPQAPQQQRQRANSMRSIGSDHHAHVGHHALHAAHHHQPPPHHHPAMHPHHPAAHHAAIAAHHAQTDPTAAAAAAAFDASSAWFMPFNMEPPEIGHDMAMGGPGGGAMSGPGVGSGTLDAFAGMFATGAAAGPGPGGPRMHPGGGH